MTRKERDIWNTSQASFNNQEGYSNKAVQGNRTDKVERERKYVYYAINAQQIQVI